jgi:hypothetical protein
VHDINCHLRKAVALAKERKIGLAYNPLRPETCLLEDAFCGAQGGFFVFNRNQHMAGQRLAECFVRALIRTREESPGIGEALHRGGDDTEAYQAQQ